MISSCNLLRRVWVKNILHCWSPISFWWPENLVANFCACMVFSISQKASRTEVTEVWLNVSASLPKFHSDRSDDSCLAGIIGSARKVLTFHVLAIRKPCFAAALSFACSFSFRITLLRYFNLSTNCFWLARGFVSGGLRPVAATS